MSTQSETPGPSGAPSSSVFTPAQRKVLAFLFFSGGPVKQLDLSATTLLGMGGGVVTVLKSLAARNGLVYESPAGSWSLRPLARELMALGAELPDHTAAHGREAVRHVR